MKPLVASSLLLILAACQAPAAGPRPVADARALVVGAEPAAIAAAGDFVYVGSRATGDISVIDAGSEAVVKTLANPGGSVSHLGSFQDGRHVLALDAKLGTARVLDPANGHAVLQTIALGAQPSFAILSPDNPTVMVALAGEPKAVLLTFEEDRARPPVRREFPVGSAGTAAWRELGYDHDWVVVPNAQEGNVTLFNILDGTPKTLAGARHTGAAVMGVWGGVARQAIVANGDDSLSLFEIPSGNATTLRDLGREPAAVRAEESLRRAYVAMRGSDELAVIDYDKKRVFGRVPVGKRPSSITITPALAPTPNAYRLKHEEDDSPREVWVGNEGDASVTVVDAATLLVKATFKAGNGPHAVAFARDKAFVANRSAGTVSVIDRHKAH